MGLDICVRKPFKPKRFDSKKHEYVTIEVDTTLEDPLVKGFEGLIIETELEFYDEEAALIREGKEPSKFNLVGMEFGENEVFTFRPVGGGDSFEIENIPLVTRKTPVLCYEEVGYQRKGANSQFYVDGMWDSLPILSLQTIEEHEQKYFLDAADEFKDFRKTSSTSLLRVKLI